MCGCIQSCDFTVSVGLVLYTQVLVCLVQDWPARDTERQCNTLDFEHAWPYHYPGGYAQKCEQRQNNTRRKTDGNNKDKKRERKRQTTLHEASEKWMHLSSTANDWRTGDRGSNFVLRGLDLVHEDLDL